MRFSVATFNVKDLIADLYPDPARLDAKLERLARDIDRADPDVLALQEVGSEALVRALVAKTKRGHGAFEVAMGSPDARGIGCAVVSFLPVAAARVHVADQLPFPVFVQGEAPPFPGRLPLRRAVVHAEIAVPSAPPVHLFVAHFKSKHLLWLGLPGGLAVTPASPSAETEGLVRSLVWRLSEALFVRGLVDDVVARDPEARVIVAGDLNDDPESAPVQVVRGVGAGRLSACAEAIPLERRYSILHEGRAQQIDHLLVTESLGRGLVSAAFLNEELRDHGPFDPDHHVVTHDSDHALLLAQFDLLR